EVLMLAYAFDDSPVQQWVPMWAPMPQDLQQALTDPMVAKVAFNAAFERLVTRHVLQVEVPIEQWRCTMVMGYYLGFAGGLDAQLEATGLQARKDPRGGRLIHMFSKPAPGNHKAARYTYENRPREFKEFCEYN